MKNDIFNLTRFGRYLGSELKAAMANYGLSLAIICGIGLLTSLVTGFFGLIIMGSWASSAQGVRAFIFLLAMLTLILTLPVKLYGHVTDKRSGSSFVMLPVSSLEKTFSMLLVSCIVVPAIFFAAYMGLDAIYCAFDAESGKSLLSIMFTIGAGLNELVDLEEITQLGLNLNGIANPLVYIDDMIQLILVFLLGAICFKKSKNAKTICCLILVSIAISMISTPIILNYSKHLISGFTDDVALLGMLNDKFGWLLNHIALVDTINDTVMNLALAAAIFFRVKTIKH